MKITEVRIFPVESRDGKLKAFATMTFDDWFVVRNVKVIQGNSGLFVAMPSRKAVDSCPKCKFKNARSSRFCNQCGAEIGQKMPAVGTESAAEHMDIAHPIKQECRMYIQEQVLEAYTSESDKQQQEGGEYKPQTDEGLSTTSQKLESSEEESQDIEL
ncbi:MAG: septation protein SpoVG family protein [Candidatus Omnitrophota bacterium]